MNALGFSASPNVRAAVRAEAERRHLSVSAFLRRTVCEAIGIVDDTRHAGEDLSGLSFEERRERRARKYSEWRERNKERRRAYMKANRSRFSEMRKADCHARRAEALRMTVDEYEALLASGHYGTAAMEAKRNPDPKTPKSARFREVHLNSRQQCIDCSMCTVTGKCYRWKIPVVGPHVCDLFKSAVAARKG